MRKSIILGLCLAVTAVFVLASSSAAAPTWDNNPNGFEPDLKWKLKVRATISRTQGVSRA